MLVSRTWTNWLDFVWGVCLCCGGDWFGTVHSIISISTSCVSFHVVESLSLDGFADALSKIEEICVILMWCSCFREANYGIGIFDFRQSHLLTALFFTNIHRRMLSGLGWLIWASEDFHGYSVVNSPPPPAFPGTELLGWLLLAWGTQLLEYLRILNPELFS